MHINATANYFRAHQAGSVRFVFEQKILLKLLSARQCITSGCDAVVIPGRPKTN
jgi:hypothetical protein